MKPIPQGIRRIRTTGKNFYGLLSASIQHSAKTDLTAMAGSLAFSTVLSLVPLLAVSFSVFQVFGGLDYAYEKLMPFILEILSEGTGEVVETHLRDFITQTHARTVGWAGIAGLLITATMTYLTVVRAFGKIWNIEKAKSLQHRILRAITLVSIGPPLAMLSIAVTTAVATRIQNIPYSGQLIAYALTLILYVMVYALVPMVKVPLKLIVLGSIVPAALLEVAKFGYAVYTRKMVSYSAFYGSFAAIPLLLLWIYIAWIITLYGAVWIKLLHNKGRSK